MSLFNFKSLINKYMTGSVLVIHKDGYYDVEGDGRYKETKKEVALDLFAIVPLTRDELRFDSGGTYNHDSRKLYCYKHFNKGDYVINTMNNGDIRRYRILNMDDYSDFDEGLVMYYLERTDADGERETN